MEDEEEEMGHQQSIEQAGEGWSFISFHHDASALKSVGSASGFDLTVQGVPRGQS